MEKKVYTIIVKKQRIEVDEAVYRAYHQFREAERYQQKLIWKYELSMEQFQENGVSVEYKVTQFNDFFEEKLVKQDEVQRLKEALLLLDKDEQMLINELFLLEISERVLSVETGIPQKTINNRKKKVLLKLKEILES